MDFNNPQNNDYEEAIIQVSSILESYSQDHQFTAVGFGGKPKSAGAEVSHCFKLGPSSTVIGCNGILDAYRTSVMNVGLYGPTLFSEFLQRFYS